MTDYKFECGFCGTKFVNESRFLKHKCKQMIRDEEFRTPVGQAAWLYYQSWMRAYRRQIPKSSAFLHSKFYNSFVRFAKFVKRVNLPDPDTFIWFMKEKDVTPTIWNSDAAYGMYLEFLDHRGDPKKQAEITINTLFSIADAAECTVSDVFDVLTANEVIQLLRERRFTPWLLLNSSKFAKFFVNSTSGEERIIMESIVRPQYWAKKFEKHPKSVQLMKIYVEELNL